MTDDQGHPCRGSLELIAVDDECGVPRMPRHHHQSGKGFVFRKLSPLIWSRLSWLQQTKFSPLIIEEGASAGDLLLVASNRLRWGHHVANMWEWSPCNGPCNQQPLISNF